MLIALISGFKQPINEIDIYLAPLVDDLKKIWHDGVECYDVYLDQCFMFKAILLWPINIFLHMELVCLYGQRISCMSNLWGEYFIRLFAKRKKDGI